MKPLRMAGWLLMATFVLVLAMIWLDEALDLPHVLLGAPATPVNYPECWLESAFVIVLAAVVAGLWRWLLGRLHYFESLHVICASCHKVKQSNAWTPLEQFLKERTDSDISHGICPQCCRRLYPDTYEKMVAQGYFKPPET